MFYILIIWIISNCLFTIACSLTSLILIGAKRDTEDRIIPRSVDADDSDVEVKSDDER